MTDTGLTAEEKLCLQRWFRQAIVKLEQDAVVEHLMDEWRAETKPAAHRESVSRRRPARLTPRFAHQGQLLGLETV